MSRSKQKGTAAETALVRWFQTNGFPHADRQPLRGNRDTGDINLGPGIVVEAKNYNGAVSLGQPPAATLTKWMHECEAEKTNANAVYCPLVVKRAGTTDPGRWFAYTTITDLATLTGGTTTNTNPVCMSVDTLTTLLRHAGYGTTPEETTP